MDILLNLDGHSYLNSDFLLLQYCFGALAISMDTLQSDINGAINF
jgi:hypothetical protein